MRPHNSWAARPPTHHRTVPAVRTAVPEGSIPVAPVEGTLWKVIIGLVWSD